jgi:nucleotide-binding universal stress UspA family protein
MSGPFQLTVGLDLRPQTTGAVQYALWMCKAPSLQPSWHLHFIHVIEPDAMVELIRHADERTMLGAFRQRGKEILDEVAHGEHLHAPEVLAGDAVELLEEVAKKQGSTALMISRRAASRAGMTLERLGAVARRLLRRLEQPTIVVPPDLLASRVGSGPVVVAVDFSEDSARAVAWARTVAETVRRPLRLVHFADIPDQAGYAGLVQAERWEELSNEILDRGRERMRKFVVEQRLGEVDTMVVRGPVLPAVADYANESAACLLVTGSGHHGMLHRIVVPSVASETAAMSSVPVAVVP